MNNRGAEWMCRVARQLDDGDEIMVNQRQRPLTVTDTNPGDYGGFPFDAIALEGNGTDYTVRIPEDDESRPLLQWPSSDSMTTIWKLEVEGSTQAMVSEMSATEFIQGIGESEPLEGAEGITGGSAADPDDVDDSAVLGTCPDCEGDVVENEEQAQCTNCELWCWMSEWNTHYAEA